MMIIVKRYQDEKRIKRIKPPMIVYGRTRWHRGVGYRYGYGAVKNVTFISGIIIYKPR